MVMADESLTFKGIEFVSSNLEYTFAFPGLDGSDVILTLPELQELWANREELRATAQKLLLCFSDDDFNIPAYIVEDLRKAVKGAQ